MPLDHYVSQVHLRKFYSPSLGNRMYAIRKTDLKVFTPDAQSVCRIMDGSTNAYLRNDRAIEEFLKAIEPNYNNALDKLIGGEIDHQCVFTIAGFVAYVVACSPGAMRMQSGPLKSAVETTAAIMDAQGALPPSPAQLGGACLTDLLRDGTIEVTIDPKYPQAIGVQSILRFVALFGNFKWEILRNQFEDSPFFTSDFPAAIEPTDVPGIVNRIVPLAPTLAIRIIPDLTIDKSRADVSFPNFQFRRRDIDREEVEWLNLLIVRCAEETVFYRDDLSWVRPFVTANRHYRIEPYTTSTQTPTGKLLVFSQRIIASGPLGAQTDPAG
jgi:hypothetical protein